MIKKELIKIGVFFFFTNIIFAQHAIKKSERLPRKGIIINEEGTPDIIQRQDAYDKQNLEMIQFHKEAEYAKQAREIEFKKKEMEILVAKQKASELLKQKAEEKQLALQKKETVFYLCVTLCLIFFSVLGFIFFNNNFKNKLK